MLSLTQSAEGTPQISFTLVSLSAMAASSSCSSAADGLGGMCRIAIADAYGGPDPRWFNREHDRCANAEVLIGAAVSTRVEARGTALATRCCDRSNRGLCRSGGGR